MRLLLLAVFALLASCSQKPPAQATRIVQKTASEKPGNSSLKLEYPVIEGASNALNRQLALAALTHLEQVEDDPIPFQEFAKNFGADAAGHPWVKESILTIEHSTPAIVTTLCKTLSDIGDGPPNRFHYYEVYDAVSGRRLELDDLLEAEKLDALRALANVKGDFPNEPAIGLLQRHLVFRPDPDARTVPDTTIEYARLHGILKPRFLP